MGVIYAGYICKNDYLAGTENSVADLLSPVPGHTKQLEDSALSDPDISNKTYKISALNSNRFNPKHYARCQPQFKDKVTKPTFYEPLDIKTEQEKDTL